MLTKEMADDRGLWGCFMHALLVLSLDSEQGQPHEGVSITDLIFSVAASALPH